MNEKRWLERQRHTPGGIKSLWPWPDGDCPLSDFSLGEILAFGVHP